MLKRVWTKDEDTQLCEAVEVLGESDWQSVASTLEKDGLVPNVLIGQFEILKIIGVFVYFKGNYTFIA